MDKWQAGVLTTFLGLGVAFLWNISQRMDQAVDLLRHIAASTQRHDEDE